jgi:hypothetical protein
MPLREHLVAKSRQKVRRVESIELIRQQRSERKQDLLFNSRPFLLCGLPIRRPPSGTLIHERRNGHFVLHVCGHPHFGLPYGQDRLVPIWVATQAVRLRSREIHFGTAADILNELGLPLDGIHYRRLIESFQRVFASTIYFGREHRQNVWECARFNYFERLRLWRNAVPGTVEADGNSVVLSEAFFTELRNHPIPVEREVVRALAHSAGALDFYMWLVWRSYGRTTGQRVPLFSASGLISQVGTSDYGRPRDFARTVRRWLNVVQQFWPSCPAELAPDGTALILRPAKVIHNAL